MRILFLNQFYKPDIAATGQLLADLASELVQRGHEVHVICSRCRYEGGRLTLDPKEHTDGVHVHRVFTIGFGREKLLGRTIDYFLFYLGIMWRAFRLSKPDVCVSLTTPPFISLIGLIISKLRGSRNVIWVMDVYPEIAAAYDVLDRKSVLYHLLTRLNNLLFRNASAVISLGEVMTKHLEYAGARTETLYTVHNWVPSEVVFPGNS